jgi:hypothetical protein
LQELFQGKWMILFCLDLGSGCGGTSVLIKLYLLTLFVGTNNGAALLNLEKGALSWLHRCKSDILSLQFVHSVKFILDVIYSLSTF